MSKKEALESLKNTYCRLKPSKVSGVGVFAIREIPKGKNPFWKDEKNWYRFNVSDFKGFDKELMKMIDDFFVIEEDGGLWVPKSGLNGMSIAFFVNHSKKPNIKTVDGGDSFLTLRKVKKGEELVVSYGTYDWKYK